MLSSRNLFTHIEKLKILEDYLLTLLKNKFGNNIKINNDTANKIPGIVSVQFIGINNEILVKKLAPIMAVSTCFSL